MKWFLLFLGPNEFKITYTASEWDLRKYDEAGNPLTKYVFGVESSSDANGQDDYNFPKFEERNENTLPSPPQMIYRKQPDTVCLAFGDDAKL